MTGGSGSRDFAAGDVLAGRYRLDRLLSAGGAGRVFAGTQLTIDRPVAVKLLHPHLASADVSAARFRREAQALTRVASAHVYDFGVHQGAPFLIMELVDGLSLRDLVKRDGPLTVRRATRLLSHVAQALVAAADAGLTHRDLKPANVVVSQSHGEIAKVVDFGIAADARDDEHLTREGLVLGTPSYMAPEQVVGEPVDHRTDLYALGCVLHAVLTGAAPFAQGDASGRMMAQVCREAPALPDPLPSGEALPAGLAVLHPVAREMKRQRCVVDRWIKREEINVLEYRCPVDRPLLDDAYAAIERALDGLSLAIAVRWAA